MKKSIIYLILPLMIGLQQCKNCSDEKSEQVKKSSITEATIKQVADTLVTMYGEKNKELINKGVAQAAALWYESDGTSDDFKKFCKENYLGTDSMRETVFLKIQHQMEVLNGNFNRITIGLMEPLHLDKGELMPIDELFGSYSVSAHLADDFFANKIAFVTILNFPAYTLKEKNEMGASWNRLQWAYARLGDYFSSRVPAELIQKVSETVTASDTYISEYNIYMGNLVDDNNKTLFAKDLKLITHWGLRDELKSNYKGEAGLEKQKMIYEVMKKIITQEIPFDVINSDKFQWNPKSNKLTQNGSEIKFKPEPDTRYEHLKNVFLANKSIDAYSPQYPTYIQRKFDGEMEMSQEEVEKLFTDFISSPQVKEVANLIKNRLGRDLQPFDIWYDGFKSRSTISETELTDVVKTKYPTKDKFQQDLPLILQKLQFTPEKANEISSKINVDASRGAGHAWGSEMRGDNAHLRTRVGKDGMDYKGYNIAVHEFGHTVEQTLSLYDMDYYTMKGVPNTAFTEALAFIFQKRDLELVGIKNADPLKEDMLALDNFWACYEIMGVSLVDMQVWKWLYANPEATPAQLKEQVIIIAKDVWNKYYAPVFGSKDEPILAIYSHMIDAPLYLSAYPVGHLIDFQIEGQIKGKNFAAEVQRMYTQGRLIPQIWMKNAVGKEISNQPMLDATTEALKKVK
jgi:hypothetical protein